MDSRPFSEEELLTVVPAAHEPAAPPLLPPPWPEHGPRIRDVRVILTAPDDIRLVVVKVETDEPGLYGLGCATFTQRPLAVVTAIEQYVRPQVIGRSVHDIEDLWSMLAVSSYWRSGPVLNNAMSGLDMALWDLKGKLADMPVYDLLGGRCRIAAPAYVHASGRDAHEVEDDARRLMAQGFRHIRCQVAVPGASTYGVSQALDSDEPHPITCGSRRRPGTRRPTSALSRPCSSISALHWATRWNCCTTSTNASPHSGDRAGT